MDTPCTRNRLGEGLENALCDELFEDFFEVSKIVDSPEMLKGWVDWFARLRIPCAIERRRSGYALWRKGKEAGQKKAKLSYPLNRRNVVYSSMIARR
jgi:hypothetical protein